LQNQFRLLATSYESLVCATLLHGTETADNQQSWRWYTTDSRGKTRNVLKDMITSKAIRRWSLTRKCWKQLLEIKLQRRCLVYLDTYRRRTWDTLSIKHWSEFLPSPRRNVDTWEWTENTQEQRPQWDRHGQTRVSRFLMAH